MEASNVKAMRDALVAVKKSIDDIGKSSLDCDPTILMASLTLICGRLSARIEHALAAPPRNCDVGTAEEQAERMAAFCSRRGKDESGAYRCENCILLRVDRCELAWAQMPYTEGGGK